MSVSDMISLVPAPPHAPMEQAMDKGQDFKANSSLSRFLTHISSDKPVYKPKEQALFRGVILNAFNYAPVPTNVSGVAKIISPKGDTIHHVIVESLNSAIGIRWRVPEATIGGTYTLRIEYAQSQMKGLILAPAERKFDIKKFSAPPRMNMQSEFATKGLGPSDRATITLSVKRAESGVPKGAAVTVIASVDDKEIHREDTSVPDSGEVTSSFVLPDKIEKGDSGMVTFKITDGGNVETHSKTIPILSAKVDVEFFPEGGHLVAGLPCMMYFQAWTPWGDPADISAEVVSNQVSAYGYGAVEEEYNSWTFQYVGEFSTTHEGRGKFQFTPDTSKQYYLRVLKPSGVSKLMPFPKTQCRVEENGVILRPTKTRFSKGEPVELQLWSTTSRSVTVTLSKKEMEVSSVSTTINSSGSSYFGASSATTVTLTPPTGFGDGVLVATVWDNETDLPLCERLIYREPRRFVKVDVKTDREAYTPGQPVKVTVATKDEHDQPIGGVFLGITCSDESVQEMVERRKQNPRLREMALLESEVKELFDSPAYLTSDAKGDENVDLLLGTQGWRTFVLFSTNQEVENFLKEHGSKAQRVAALNANYFLSSPDPLEQIVGTPLVTTKLTPQPRSTRFSNRKKLREPQLPSSSDDYSDEDDLSITLKPTSDTTQMKPSSVITSILSAFGNKPGSFSGPRPDSSAAPTPDVLSLDLEEDQLSPKKQSKKRVEKSDKLERSKVEGRTASRAIKTLELQKPQAIEGEEEELSLSVDDAAPSPPSPSTSVSQGAMALSSLRQISRPGPTPTSTKSLAAPKQGQSLRRLNQPIAKPVDTTITALRLYAHRRNAGTFDPEVRTDFTETVFWVGSAATSTNRDDKAQYGTYTFTFDLSDNITTFKLQIDAFCKSHLFGVSDTTFESKLPFSVEAKIPIETSLGDILRIPITLSNSTTSELAPASFTAHEPTGSLKLSDFAREDLRIPPDSSIRKLVTARSEALGLTRLFKVEGKAADHKSGVSRPFSVLTNGFPMQASWSVSLDKTPVIRTISLPADLVPGSLHASVNFFVDNTSNFNHILQSLIREPYGCFEQVGATLFPMIGALVFLKTEPSSLETVRTAQRHLEAGYNKIKAYEVRGTGGFEWWGGTPAHEALSAFGLIMLHYMKQVYEVDNDLVERTKKFLLTRRTKTGGFQIASGKYAFSSPPQNPTEAYIMWALTETGMTDQKELEAEIAHMKRIGREGAEGAGNHYTGALAAISLANLGLKEEATTLAGMLVNRQRPDGGIGNETSSYLHNMLTIVRSGYQGARIETTALTIIAWTKLDREVFAEPLNKAVAWLYSQCTGSFYSTQTTALAILAIVAYESGDKTPGILRAGDILSVHLDNKEVFSYSVKSGLNSANFSLIDLLKPNTKQELKLVNTFSKRVTAQVTLRCETLSPPSNEACSVRMSTKLAKDSIPEGEAMKLNVQVTNIRNDPLGMVLACVGIPAGLQPRVDKIKEFIKAEKLDFYEITPRKLVLYWRGMHAEQTHELDLDLEAIYPGEYTAAASSAYEYYRPENKDWQTGLKVTIEPSKEN